MPVQAPMRSTRVSRSAGLHPGRRLVEQQEARLGHEGPRELEQLPLAAREHAGGLARVRLELDEVQQRRALAWRRSSTATAAGRVQFVQNRSPSWSRAASMTFSSTVIAGNGRGTWKVRATPRRAPGGRLAVEPAPVEEDPPGVRREGAGDRG